MRVHVSKQFPLAAASRFGGGMCRADWAVPARPAEDTVYQGYELSQRGDGMGMRQAGR